MSQPVTWGRAERRGCVILLALALVVLAGIGVFVWFTFFSLRAHEGAVDISHDLTKGCGGAREYFPSADAYSGRGPHPIAVFRDSDSGGGSQQDISLSDAGEQYNESDGERVQLILCLGASGKGERVGLCKFSGGDHLPLYRGEYDAVLYESKTGEKVAEAKVRGSESEDDCPRMIYVKGEPDLHTSPDGETIKRAFGRYVEATR